MILGPHIIATEYEHFAKANVPPGASLGQYADMQRAFFGGVLFVLRLTDILSELEDEQAIEALNEVRDEANGIALSQFIIGTALAQGDKQS